MNNELSLLGLATKASKTISGESMVLEAIRNGQAKLVIVACDASDNTKKSYTDMCSYKKVPIIFYGDKDTLVKCIGCEERAAVVILDEGFANAVNKEISAREKKN